MLQKFDNKQIESIAIYQLYKTAILSIDITQSRIIEGEDDIT